ncbi:MAG: hypothetical protein JJ964_14935 [Rhizobiales bacterium]|nr:hypothetical protein [Hyphomicrobiales bacterium]
MDPIDFKSKWPVLKPQVTEKWPEITKEEAENIDGEYSVMITTLQAKYFYVQEEAELEIEKFFKSFT